MMLIFCSSPEQIIPITVRIFLPHPGKKLQGFPKRSDLLAVPLEVDVELVDFVLNDPFGGT